MIAERLLMIISSIFVFVFLARGFNTLFRMNLDRRARMNAMTKADKNLKYVFPAMN
jgi:hypothetical protein